MLLYCLRCKQNAESKDLKVVKIKNRRIMLLSKCVMHDNKKSKFINDQELSGLLSNLGIKTPLRKILLVGLPLFKSIK